MKSRSCSRRVVLLVAAGALLGAAAGMAQFRGVQAAAVTTPKLVQIKAGEELSFALQVAIRPGYHINSDNPAEDYLIPTRLSWDAPALKLKSVDYPEAETVKYEFSEVPLRVFSGSITLRSTFAVPDSLPAGLSELTGKFRYQACTEKACLAPVTVNVSVPVAVN